jgi:hypothetical protein
MMVQDLKAPLSTEIRFEEHFTLPMVTSIQVTLLKIVSKVVGSLSGMKIQIRLGIMTESGCKT